MADALAATADKFVAEPANAGSSERSGRPEALGKACRVVITMLPDGKVVRDVLLGANGIAKHLAAGSVVDRYVVLLARRHARAACGSCEARFRSSTPRSPAA